MALEKPSEGEFYSEPRLKTKQKAPQGRKEYVAPIT